MTRLISLLLVALALTGFGAAAPAAAGGPGAAQAAARSGAVPGQYIVTLKPGQKPAGFLARSGIATRFVYDAALNGFSAKLSLGQLAALKRSPEVVRIDQDQYVRAYATQTSAPWGLDRIDQANLPLSTTYTYNTSASNVNVYVIDTGIQTAHPQFGGRAALAYDALGGNGQDCNGHGTHVAGIIGSSTYGVAKGVKLWSVRVLDCNGSGTWTQVVNGINWVAANHIKPAVANMSLGGSANTSVDNAVTNLVNKGVFTTVPIGGSNADGCTSTSPARAAGAFVVASSDSSDRRASFSNYGACVKVYAPGVSIASTWLNGGTNTISGTSTSCAFAAGVGALYKATFGDAASATVTSWIVTNAIPNKITNNPSSTPNRLLSKASL